MRMLTTTRLASFVTDFIVLGEGRNSIVLCSSELRSFIYTNKVLYSPSWGICVPRNYVEVRWDKIRNHIKR